MKMIELVQCSSFMYWYRDMVGQSVPLVREDSEYYWAREPAGYLNIVNKNDAVIREVSNADS